MPSFPPEATADLSPEEIKTLYPPDLQLQYVQIFFRHGISFIPYQTIKESNYRRADSSTTTTTACRNTTVVECMSHSRSIQSYCSFTRQFVSCASVSSIS